jgi:hypothetical protein
LQIGLLADSLISSIFTPGIPPPLFVQNGNVIVLAQPGQVLFNSFFIRSGTIFRYFGVNTEAALAIDHFATIIVETEESNF